MLSLYQTNLLTVVEITDYSIYVDGGDFGDVLLHEAPEDTQIGDNVQAFAYLDSSGEPVATMAKPYAQIGECAYLEVISSGENGTFLNWGLPKDLLLPFSEQVGSVRAGDFCVVYIYQDEEGRPVASMKLYLYLNEHHDTLEVRDAVDVLIASKSELGYKAVINNEQLGLIYHGELSQPLEIGARMKGWVKKIREDGKINININKLDNETRDELEEAILDELIEAGGRLNLSDKSSPDLIYECFNVSKKNFKRALGSLYKKRLITIAPEFIEIISKNN